MDKTTRRSAIGAIAATAVVGAGVGAQAQGEGRRPPVKKLTLAEFREMKEPADIEAVLNRLNGGTFMDCHVRIREETGIWIPELVPIFQKLDAKLAFKALPADLG
jgi:hypothetical protein